VTNAYRRGKRVGIDYLRVLNRAIENDPAGLDPLFRFTVSDGFVGAAAENHCLILLGLLQRLGDSPFAKVLRYQTRHVRKAVIDAIDYAFPYPAWNPRQFPITYSLAPHEHAPNVSTTAKRAEGCSADLLACGRNYASGASSGAATTRVGTRRSAAPFVSSVAAGPCS
jgi:hypothetical protein